MSVQIKRRKKADRQKTIDSLDALFREYIRKRAMQRVGGCERCGAVKLSHKELDTAHIHRAGKYTVRWDPRNAAGLCGGCHTYLDNHIDAKQKFAREYLGEEEYERLYVLAEMTTKQSPIDYTMVEIVLGQLLREVNNE